MAEPHIEQHILMFLEELKTFIRYFNITLLEQKRLAQAVQNKHDEIGRSFDYENDDDGIVWSRANEKVLGNDEVWITEHKLFIIGGYFIIIFHAFERYLEDIFDLAVKHELPDMLKNGITAEQRKAIEGVLKADKLDTLGSFFDIFPEAKNVKEYKKVCELRTVCNVFKHGRGSALERLKKIRPDITKHLDYSFSRLLRPFREYSLNVEPKMIYEYVDSIKAFLFQVFDIKTDDMFEYEKIEDGTIE